MTRAKRILVPLDGTERSEAVVPIAAAVARDSGGTVRLLRVYPIPARVVDPHGRTVAYTDQEMARLTAEGEHDLARSEARMHGVPVERVVRFGKPVEEIVLEAEAFGADAITLAAPPRSWLRAVTAPGVAERVTRAASIPTLVLRTPA
jgi:nucleotide-binding universal stress UspA family protein